MRILSRNSHTYDGNSNEEVMEVRDIYCMTNSFNHTSNFLTILKIGAKINDGKSVDVATWRFSISISLARFMSSWEKKISLIDSMFIGDDDEYHECALNLNLINQFKTTWLSDNEEKSILLFLVVISPILKTSFTYFSSFCCSLCVTLA